MIKDYYTLLEVPKEASSTEIKKAFHRLAFLHHPDRNKSALAEEYFKEINEAYQCLSDLQKRKNYDLGKPLFQLYSTSAKPYLNVEISADKVKLNEEFEITYRYIGEGHFFRKPQNKNLLFTSGPVVSHRNFQLDGVAVRETSLSYTIVALETGMITLNPATIEVRHQHIQSNKVQVEVETNECYFKQGLNAGKQPLIIYLHKEQFSSNTVYRKNYVYRHTILLPRSDYAAFYHRIGAIMKVTFTVCGFFLFALKDQYALVGLLCGSAAGGIACQLMYWMSGIHSKYFYAYNFPLVEEYLEKQYEIGNDPVNIFIENNVIQRIVMMFK